MKSELRENMYVRTKDGIIAKVDYIDDNTIFFDKELYRIYGDSINFLEKDDLERIIKASYNIIDILEKGDYVNGHRVEEIDFENEEIFTDSEYYCGIVEFCNIKSVITHEQMEQMAYKVGD